MKNQEFGVQFSASRSYETTPERHSSVSDEPLSSLQSPSSSSQASPYFGTNEKSDDKNKKFGIEKKGNSYVYRIREHVRLGPKLSETVKGKLSLGARIIQQGGRKNVFSKIFNVSDGEKLLKASQCYLSTTAGPIAGILFISTQKVAFCSERPISFPSPDGDSVRSPYKVLIPIKKIKRANGSENANKPAQKYIEIVTEDNFEFWFMGFVSRLDNWEKQSEIRIWPKKKQGYGYHDRPPSRKKNISKSLRVAFKHPKYAGIVNDIAFPMYWILHSTFPKQFLSKKFYDTS